MRDIWKVYEDSIPSDFSFYVQEFKNCSVAAVFVESYWDVLSFICGHRQDFKMDKMDQLDIQKLRGGMTMFTV